MADDSPPRVAVEDKPCPSWQGLRVADSAVEPLDRKQPSGVRKFGFDVIHPIGSHPGPPVDVESLGLRILHGADTSPLFVPRVFARRDTGGTDDDVP